MQEHVIYYFSGTGNSLKTALTLQKSLKNCDVIPMRSLNDIPQEQSGLLSSIGFVFPCNFGGVPAHVLNFIADMELPELPQKGSIYTYAIVTYGAISGTAVGQVNHALQKRGIALDYAANLKSFSNYVLMYDMSNKVAEKTAQTKTDLQSIIKDVTSRKTIPIKKASAVVMAYNRMGSKDVLEQDKNFVVSESCNKCGACERVCPASNIKLNDGKPLWLGSCTQCLACLQWCPERAIDYGKKTQKRGRYTNPEITLRMFIDYLNGAGINN